MRNCLICKTIISSKKVLYYDQKYCSYSCSSKAKGAPRTAFKKGMIPWNKGLKDYGVGHPGHGVEGKDNYLWKGDEVGYRALHSWVVRHLGQPDTCEFCEETGLSAHKIHWANKSHEYKRELEDWLRLCTSCHGEYDANRRRVLA